MEISVKDDPFDLFDAWFDLAKNKEVNDPNAMCLATSTPDGAPSARIVLLKEHDKRGFVFYTNTQSRKGQELTKNKHAALCFHWKSLQRQIRIEGRVEKVSDAQADAYYQSRHRGSRIGAWASQQSAELDTRETLKQRVEEFEEKFKDLEDIPRPDHWSGFRVVPHRIEFWDDGEYRLHDRFVFDKHGSDWNLKRLYP